jgi:spore germination protein KB
MKPVLHGAYYTFGFPFAEVVLFGMLLPFVNKETGKSLGKLMVLTLLFNVVILILVVDCTMMAVGPLSGELKYSLYELARLISVGDFIERIESVIGLSLTIGSYMKATIVLYVLNLALANTLKIKDMRIFTLPLALVSFFLTLVMFDNESEFVERVTVVWPLMNIVCTVIPLLTITLVTIMRGMFSNQANKAAPKP